MDSRASNFLDYIERIFNKKAEFYEGKKPNDNYPTPSILVFNDIPEPHYMTCVTYGLSYAQHEKWINNRRPELIMSINNQNTDWAIALVDLVSDLRGVHPFSYGQTIKLGKPLVPGSDKTGFLFFAPAILNRDTYLDIDIGADYKICLTGAYPVTSANMKLVVEIGMEKFWKSPEFGFLEVT